MGAILLSISNGWVLRGNRSLASVGLAFRGGIRMMDAAWVGGWCGWNCGCAQLSESTVLALLRIPTTCSSLEGSRPDQGTTDLLQDGNMIGVCVGDAEWLGFDVQPITAVCFKEDGSRVSTTPLFSDHGAFAVNEGRRRLRFTFTFWGEGNGAVIPSSGVFTCFFERGCRVQRIDGTLLSLPVYRGRTMS